MELLDLPPEVFQRITGYYVAKVGLAKAWKQREVCKAFKAFITHEVLGRQPMHVYARISNRKLLQKGLNLFLEYRTNVLYGAHDFIPNLINKAVGEIMRVTGQTGQETRTDLIQKTSLSFKLHCPKASYLVLRPKGLARTMEKHDKFEALLACLVSGMGEIELARKTFESCNEAWTLTKCFGYPIQVAVSAQDMEMAMLLLDIARKLDPRIFSKNLEPVVTQVLQKVESRRRTQSAPDRSPETSFMRKLSGILLSYYASRLPAPTNNSCHKWFQAVTGNSTYVPALARQILDIPHDDKLAESYCRHWFDFADWQPRLWVMKLLLKRGVLKPDVFYTNSRSTTNYGSPDGPLHHRESLLMFCVRMGAPDIVQVALEAGAHPDGLSQRNKTREYPIREALSNERCSVDILKLLLKYGADPRKGTNTVAYCLAERAQKISGKYDVLNKAVAALKNKDE